MEWVLGVIYCIPETRESITFRNWMHNTAEREHHCEQKHTHSKRFGLVALPTKVKEFSPGYQSFQIVFEMW